MTILASKNRKRRMTLHQKQSLTGWLFILPAAILILWMSFYPMARAFVISLMRGKPTALQFSEPLMRNYQRMLQDKVFIQALKNTFIYLIVQVPIMLFLALIFASLLNKRDLKFKGIFRTCIFLPCATALVSYAIIFRALFAYDGIVNAVLMSLHVLEEPINWLNHPNTARIVIILALIWRWTGYNMVFYLSAMQTIDYSIYESARIDGAGPLTQLTKITFPLLKPVILVTAIMSTNGTLQLYDESVNLTQGGPANMTITMSHYIYNTTFVSSPNFGYAAAMSFMVLALVAVLSILQMRVGDKR